MELQQKYDDLESTIHRAEAKQAHGEGEVSRIKAKMQVGAW